MSHSAMSSPDSAKMRDAVAAEQVELLLQVAASSLAMSRASWPIAIGAIMLCSGRAHGVGAAVAEGLAPADDAGVGLDLDQQDVVGRPVAPAVARRTAAEGERHLDRMLSMRAIFTPPPLRSACRRAAARHGRGPPAAWR